MLGRRVIDFFLLQVHNSVFPLAKAYRMFSSCLLKLIKMPCLVLLMPERKM